jgi:hypothetical protein
VRPDYPSDISITVGNKQEDEIIRIDSARKAVRKERQGYDENRREGSLRQAGGAPFAWWLNLGAAPLWILVFKGCGVRVELM